MQKLVFVLLVSLAVALARPGDVRNPLPKKEDRQRESGGYLENPGILVLKHREKIFEDSQHRLDGSALLKHDLTNNKAPTQIGGKFDYNYKPADTHVGVSALNAGKFGTQVGVEATRNVFKGRNSDLEIGASYDQRFGGLGGRGEPVFGGFVRAHW